MSKKKNDSLKEAIKPASTNFQAIDKSRIPKFNTNFNEDLKYWSKINPKTVDKILELVENVCLCFDEGLGKPELLKYEAFEGIPCWSRRITQEHRLVYSVKEESVVFLQARFHYTH